MCRWRTQGKRGQQNQALGRSRGGFSSKIHVLVDALGNPLDFILTPGQAADITQATTLLADRQATFVIADKGYDADPFLQWLREKEMAPVIPPRANRTSHRAYDRHLYRERHLIECFINKFKHYRRLFSRFDKLDERFMGFLRFVAALIWLK